MTPLRLAMWSGPRNISTAMMRSWGNRPDTAVVDEPFYGFYLRRTGRKHPGAAQVIASMESDWREVVTRLTSVPPNGRAIFFQKHMTHHLLPEVDREWLLGAANCFLIRDPAAVIASYLQKTDPPTLEDIGFVQQCALFDWVRGRQKSIPPVVDARDVLQNPERMLRLLCRAVAVEFDPAMLSWPAGLRESDGVWAKHWYREVAESTSFQPYAPKPAPVPAELRAIHGECQRCYEHLYQYRLR